MSDTVFDELIEKGLSITINLTGKKGHRILKLLQIILDKENAEMLLDMLNDYIEDKSYLTADFPDYWKPRIRLLKEIVKILEELFKEEKEEEEEGEEDED